MKNTILGWREYMKLSFKHIMFVLPNLCYQIQVVYSNSNVKQQVINKEPEPTKDWRPTITEVTGDPLAQAKRVDNKEKPVKTKMKMSKCSKIHVCWMIQFQEIPFGEFFFFFFNEIILDKHTAQITIQLTLVFLSPSIKK